MSDIQTITLNDASANPHDFVPRYREPNGALTCVDTASSYTAEGKNYLRVGFDPASSKRKTERTTISLEVPYEILNQFTSVYEVLGVCRGFVNTVIPNNVPADLRNDFASFLGAAVTNAVLKAYVADGDPMIS